MNSADGGTPDTSAPRYAPDDRGFIPDRRSRPCYPSREDHNWEIRTRKQSTDIGKYSFVNRTIINWRKLPADLPASFPCNLNNFRKRVKKVVTNK
jgi:hypothetical protein